MANNFTRNHTGGSSMVGNWHVACALLREKPELMRNLDMIWKVSTGLRIRSLCAVFIEQQAWLECAKDTVLANGTFANLIVDANKLAQQCDNVVQRHDMDKDCEQLKRDWAIAKIEFASKMVSCLNAEKALLESCTPDLEDRHADPLENNMADRNEDLHEQIQAVHNQLLMGNVEVGRLQDDQAFTHDAYIKWTEEKKQLIDQLQIMSENPQARNQINVTLSKKERDNVGILTKNLRLRQATVNSHRQLVEGKLQAVLHAVWSEVLRWKDCLKRRITCLVKPKDNDVEVLEELCYSLAQLLQEMMQQSKRIDSIVAGLTFDGVSDSTTVLKDVRMRLEGMVKTHLDTVFVVDRSPQIIKVVTAKSTTEIPLTVRLLGVDAFQISLPTVQTWMYRDKDLQDFPDNVDPKLKICDVINGKKMMEQNRRTKQIFVTFSAVSLQKVQATAKVPDRLVSENMYAMVFTTNIVVQDKTYTPKTMSLPIVSVTHVMQECQARGFLIWDAAFSQNDTIRKPFVNPEKVSWGHLAPVLDAYFKVNTGRGLNETQLQYLATILFKEKKMMNFSHREVSKSQLFKDSLYKKSSTRSARSGPVAKDDDKQTENKTFSFWKWFYACANLVKEKIGPEWKGLNGVRVIEGFMSKGGAESQLRGYDVGTFLLRFSERNIEDCNKGHPCGCLTIAVVQVDPDTNKERIFHVKDHLSAEDLGKHGLASILDALYVTGGKNHLCVQLYPNHPFHETFKDNLKEQGSGDDGYLKGVRRIEIFLSESQRQRHSSSSLPPQSPMSSSISMVPQSPQYPQYPAPAAAAIMLYSEDNSQSPSYGPTPTRIARVEPFENPAKMLRGQEGMGSVMDNNVGVVSPLMSPQQQQQQNGLMGFDMSLTSTSASLSSMSATQNTHHDLFTITSESSHVSNLVDLNGSSSSAAVVRPHVLVPPSPSAGADSGNTVEDMFLQEHDVVANGVAAANDVVSNLDLDALNLDNLDNLDNLNSPEQLEEAVDFFTGDQRDFEFPLEVEKQVNDSATYNGH